MALAGSFNRLDAAQRLKSERFDVIVVGGGITGAGVALDAANRGFTTAVVDQDDFASGTSSKSSKLVHGGLRYLQQGEIGLVYEALAERQVLRKIAPHLVGLMPFMIPMFKRNGLLNPKIARALGLAMWQYDLTGGVRIGKRHRRLTKQQALEHMPSLDGDNLHSAYLYFDAQADDARLTLEIIQTAVVRHGAVAANRCKVVSIDKPVKLFEVGLELDGEIVDVEANCVVNATGVWSDSVRAMDEGVDPGSIRPAKGVHIAVPRELVQTDVAVVVPVPGDKRSVFVVPWGAVTYVGTTDTDYQGDIDTVGCTKDDVDYLLSAINKSTTSELTAADVVGSWAGLRPLVVADGSGRTADLSRRHSVTVSESGVISVTGGKLTTYRRMAADAVDVVVEQHHLKRRCRTARLPLLGAGPPPDNADERQAHLFSRYGVNERILSAMIDVDASLGDPLVDGLDYLKAEAVYAVRNEMATTLDDVLSRRTRARLLDGHAALRAAPMVATLISPELGWSRVDIERQTSEFATLIEADLGETKGIY